MNNSLEQFAKIAKLSTLYRFLIILAAYIFIVGLGIFLDTTTQATLLDESVMKESTLKVEFAEKAAKASSLPVYKERLKEVETIFVKLLKQLPNKSEMDSLLNDLNHTAVSNNLSVQLFKPTDLEPKDFYAEIPVILELKGNYNQLGLFSQYVSELPRLINLNNIEITEVKQSNDPKEVKKSNVKMLEIKAIAKTYRYLDEEEIKAAKKISDAKIKAASPTPAK